MPYLATLKAKAMVDNSSNSYGLSYDYNSLAIATIAELTLKGHARPPMTAPTGRPACALDA